MKARLYEHARAMGIIGPEQFVGDPEGTPINLHEYRSKKKEATG